MAGSVVLIMARGELRSQTVEGLRDRRIAVQVADGLADALDEAAAHARDVAVCGLDIAVPDPLAACARLRRACDGLIVLGCRGRRADAVELLRAGADDFMAFPFRPAELVARARALLRRLREFRVQDAEVVTRGDVVIDTRRHVATVRGEEVALTPTEFALLRELAAGPEDLISREVLLRDIWGIDESISTRTLDVHIGRLREKIELDASRPELIVTVPRLGYRMAA